MGTQHLHKAFLDASQSAAYQYYSVHTVLSRALHQDPILKVPYIYIRRCNSYILSARRFNYNTISILNYIEYLIIIL